MSEDIRELAFDTETTGLHHLEGDRVIEIGAVEMINHIPTGRTFRTLINPKRSVSEDTVRITGITDDDLKDAPFFEHPSVVDAFLEFMGDAILVAHNAGFDRNFLNMELEKCGRPQIPDDRWIDTAMMARKKYPGAPANLDALCRRFEISLESRTFHGALLDSQLLASVYLELLGGRAHAFTFESEEELSRSERKRSARQRPEPLQSFILEEERAAHAVFGGSLGDDAIWKKAG